MSTRRRDLRRLRYEKALEIRYHEADLLFQRFNFFMVGMSFLVAAFAAVVAVDNPDKPLHDASGAIAVVGIVISLLFVVINGHASHVIASFDEDYLKETESSTGMGDGPFTAIRNHASTCPSGEIAERHHWRIWACISGCCCLSCCLVGRPIRWVFHRSRAPHTWFIPLLFAGFWAVMTFFWCAHNW